MLDFIIIGAGQSGLAMGYYLKEAGYSFTILDSNKQLGAAWLKRWDSLKLFTPTQYNHLPGLEMDLPENYYPNKYEVAEYIANYVKHFGFDVRLETLVQKVKKEQDIFSVTTSKGTIQAKQIIVATGPFHTPFIPAFASKIGSDVLQMHSKNYMSPQQLNPGATLVVGGGDSGVQILDEISQTNSPTFFSGNASGTSLPQEFLGKTLWWWFDKLGIIAAPKTSFLGRFLSKRMQPIIGTDIKAILKRPNVKAVGRSLDANESEIICETGALKGIANIIWATGFKPNFSWLEGIELDEDGYPTNERGISPIEGLFYIGLPWMHTRGSATLGGVKNDAKYLIDYITPKIKANPNGDAMFLNNNEAAKEKID